MTLIRIVCLTIGVSLLSACGNQEPTQEIKSKTSAEDVKEEFQEAAETAEQYTEDTIAQYQKSLDAKLQALQKKHEEFEDRVEKSGKEANKEVSDALAELRSKKNELTTKINNLQSSSGKAWDEMGDGVEEALKDLDEGYDRALKEFSS